MKTIGLCSDHAGFELKEYVRGWLEAKGWPYKDYGTYSTESCDYPDFAGPAAKAVASGECDRGIVVCTTGIGVSITANKVKGIRCALLSDVMAIGAGVTGEMLALEIVDTWLNTEFSHAERHQRRIDKVMALEND